MHFLLTEGNIYDCKQAENLLRPVIHKNMLILADRAYDTDKIIEFIASESSIAVIPPKKNRNNQRKYDKEKYRNRNQIERFINRIKQFKRTATRYDKLDESFLAMIHLAVVLVAIPGFAGIV